MSTGINREEALFESHPKWFLGSRITIALVFVGALLVFAAIADYGFGWVAAPWQGKLQARQQINSGDYRIAAYNHFFDLCASIQTADNNIATQQSLLVGFQRGSADYNRTLTNIGGLEATRADGINQYNADAAKGYTLGQFRASNLPFQLPSNSYKKGEQITCVN